MANGDIQSISITTTGWEAQIAISGFAIGGSYLFGTSTQLAQSDITNNTAKVALTVTSPGYTQTATTTTIIRTVYGTCARQQAYPNQALAQESVASNILTVTVALSDLIYSGETVTGAVLSGMYTDSGSGGTTLHNNAISSVAVTNSSSVTYDLPVVRCVTVPRKVVSTSFSVEYLAFHRHAQNGKPVACLKVVATDGSTSTTQFVQSMSRSIIVESYRLLGTLAGTPTDLETYTQTGTGASFQWLIQDGQNAYLTRDPTGTPNAIGVWTGVTSGATITPTAVPFAVRAGVYAAVIDPTSFAQGATISVDVWAYPWVGDVTSIRTSSGTAFPSLNLCTVQFLNDKSGTFGHTVAYVDPTNGTSGGVSSDISSFATAAATPYQTIPQAMAGIAAYNAINRTGFIASGTAQAGASTTITLAASDPNGNNGWTSITTTGGTGSGQTRTISAYVAATHIATVTVAWTTTPDATTTYTVSGKRNNADYGEVRLVASMLHVWNTATVLTSYAWLTVTRDPAATRAQVVINSSVSTSGNVVTTSLLKISGLTVKNTSTAKNPLRGSTSISLWVEDSDFIGYQTGGITNDQIVYGYGYCYYTKVNTRDIYGGLSSFSNAAYAALHRGCTLRRSNITFSDSACLMQGVAESASSLLGVVQRTQNENGIVSNCRIWKAADTTQIDMTVSIATGYAVSLNVIERVTGVTSPLAGFFRDSESYDSKHIIDWQNTFVGGRRNSGYNEGTAAHTHLNWSRRGNVDWWSPTKHDVFKQDGTRIQSWQRLYEVGTVGNFSQSAVSDLSVGFYPNFDGRNGTRRVAYQFVADGSLSDTTAGNPNGTTGSGFGDYHPTTGSNLRSRIPGADVPLAFDLYGVPIPTDGTASSGAMQPTDVAGYKISGPSSGSSGAQSSSFTLALSGGGILNGIDSFTILSSDGTLTVTSSNATITGNGTSAVTVIPAIGVASLTFSYTPASAGSKNISYTNGQGWHDPSPNSYSSLSGSLRRTLGIRGGSRGM